MKYSILKRTHSSVRLDVLRAYEDLFEGGVTFRERIREYLPRNEMEPPEVYKRRLASAPYINYCASIVNFFASGLFTCPPSLKSDPEHVDGFYAEIKEDADGTGTDLDAVFRAMVVRALVSRRAYVRVEFPAPGELPPTTLAEEDRAGLRRARLVSVPTYQVRDWKRETTGAFRWVLTHEHDEGRDDLEYADVVSETWTQWRADGSARRWATTHARGEKIRDDADIPEVEPPHNPCRAIPLVELALPAELWLLNHLAEPALDLFRKGAAESWALARSAYTMPWFFLKNREKPPKMGTGYYGILDIDEKVEWPGPNAVPFEILAAAQRARVQELHRVAQQMALGVDNNATALGRSGDSKKADHEATEIVLKAYGQKVREPIERALDLVARGRGEQIDWSVGGLDLFDLADAATLTEMADAGKNLGIPSPTYRREIFKTVAHAHLPHVDEATRQKIDAEIDASVSEGDEKRESTIPPPKGRVGEEDERPSIPPPPKVPKEMR